MKKIRIGIICPSEIAFRRFMPAVQLCQGVEYVGVAYANGAEWFGENSAVDPDVIKRESKKAESFKETYGGKVFEGYNTLINSDEIDAVYLPLPPALHVKWAEKCLQAGKHVLSEKPATTCKKDTEMLIELAKEKKLAFHENYMFAYHSQLDAIDKIVTSGKLGEIRLFRMAFGFPKRASGDFRYNKAMGGGALLDCGGYPMGLADRLLGGAEKNAKILCSALQYTDEFNVDIGGSVTMSNDDGIVAQIAFGMDNSYKCDLEIWGSLGSLYTGRIFSAPAGFVPKATLKIGYDESEFELPADDTFAKSICEFAKCVYDDTAAKNNFEKILRRAMLVDIVKGEK